MLFPLSDNYHRARYYHPALGKFLSEDPLGFEAGDMNLSRYVGNFVTAMTDPSGLEEAQDPLDQDRGG
ncbi:MAG: hypothetical protein GXY83_10635 [Rhodopirellula sp.]|nr:hypothetical protein [Rhodopirellula sp.]